MDPPNITAWAAKSLAGEPVSVVRVRNLQAVISAGHDAWGRSGKAQPLLVSAELSFRRPFARASAEDRVAADTVHYGTLSKAILRGLEPFGGPVPEKPLASLRAVLDGVWRCLTGRDVRGDRVAAGEGEEEAKPFLDLSILRFMSLTLTLPKASLLGQGVSLTASSVFGLQGAVPFVEGYATTLRLLGLRVPTLVGVNSNERNAKQVVMADIELDKVCSYGDVYTAIEDLAVKVGFIISGEETFSNRAFRRWRSRLLRRWKHWVRGWLARYWAASDL